MDTSETALFRQAVALLDTGNTAELDALLRQHPELLTAHCHQGEWYESGYFAGSTLLHHIAGNPIRSPLPANILEVTELLLQHGADPNALTDNGGTVIGLILTGKQVSEAGVSLPLIELLQAAGAKDSIDEGDAPSPPLWNCGRATAEALIARGTPFDLRHAAALGRIGDIERLIPEQPELVEAALLYACHHDEAAAVRLLLEHGARGDVLISGCFTTATALHEAAYRNSKEIVRLLLENGARADVVEPTFRGTAVGWARHAGNDEVARMFEEN